MLQALPDSEGPVLYALPVISINPSFLFIIKQPPSAA
jgi:hypothetical protein